MKFQNGDKVILNTVGSDDTVYTVSTYNEVQVWIGDNDGRGWFVFEEDIELASLGDFSGLDQNNG
jgi:ketosteroid isomerase-like protein